MNTQSSLLRRALVFIHDHYLDSKGSYIPVTVRFAGPPIFPHGMLGIFIAGDAEIGKNCVIFQHVTIGSNYLIDTKNPGAPHIGADCFIGAGAKIIGKVVVGDSVRVGANCVVFENVPPQHVAVVAPPRLIAKFQVNNRYYQRRDGVWHYMNDGVWHPEENPEFLSALNARL